MRRHAAGCAAMRCHGCCMRGRRCCAAAFRRSGDHRRRQDRGAGRPVLPLCPGGGICAGRAGGGAAGGAVCRPWAALLLLGCGLLVPVGMAVAGIGAAAASRNQFLAMARLQARFLDRVRGIATIVLYGRAEDEARSLAQAAAELRVRTMRVLRVAFLSSVVLDLAAALAMVVLAIHYFELLRQGGSADAVAGAGRAAADAGVLRAAADVLRRLSGPAACHRRGGGAGRPAAAAGTGSGA